MRNLASPRQRWRQTDPMRDHDALPQALRAWAAQAALPWSPRSLLRIWNRSIAMTGSCDAAIHRLTVIEAATLAREAPHVWGHEYPVAQKAHAV